MGLFAFCQRSDFRPPGESHLPLSTPLAQSEGYAISQRKRKLLEQGFGWAETVAGMRQVMVRWIKRVNEIFVLTMSAYYLVRMRTLQRMGQTGQVRPQSAH